MDADFATEGKGNAMSARKKLSRRTTLLIGSAALATLVATLGPIGVAESAGKKLPAEIDAIFKAKPCLTCHKFGRHGTGTLAPNLRYVGDRRSKGWLKAWMKNPQKMKPGTPMPAGMLTDAELKVMAKFLSRQRRHLNTKKIIAQHGSDHAGAGKAIFIGKDCRTCHKVGGKGGNMANTAPDLAGVSKRRSAAWLKTWLKNPRKVKKGTFMPNFHFNKSEIHALVAYLQTL